MSKNRLSKIQKWVLISWFNENLFRRDELMPFQLVGNKEYHNSMWVYYNFFNVREGKPTFKGQSFQVPNKYSSILSHSLKLLQEKGLIEIKARTMKGMGNLIFKITDLGKQTILKLTTTKQK